jgi:exonuclease VII small subunit
MSEHPELGFEDALGALEERVRSLESAGVPQTRL